MTDKDVSGKRPIVHLFRLGVDETAKERFYQVGETNLRRSYADELGTLAMYVARVSQEPTDNIVFEVYQDTEAYELHRQSPQYKYYVQEVAHQLTKREVYEVEALFLSEKLPAGVWLGAGHYALKSAQIDVKKGQEDAFEESVLTNMKTSMSQEEGVLAMYATQDKTKAGRYYFVEVYEDALAYKRHRQTKHFATYLTATKDMLEDKQLLDLDNIVAISRGGLAFTKQSDR
ncbi:putative quinol monooxygenase [Streptococcus sp. zg-JUN1979]|uniref:putative quinol monooxygenase n=1 Tax=Streptococcus sp. zg-JUN1979 TaxID=3391450 RepID=UPI0039A73823